MALPTDEKVLQNETYKKQGFVVGGKVASVGTFIFFPWTDD